MLPNVRYQSTNLYYTVYGSELLVEISKVGFKLVQTLKSYFAAIENKNFYFVIFKKCYC